VNTNARGQRDAPLDDLDDFLKESLADPAFSAAFHDATVRSEVRNELIRMRKLNRINQTHVAQAMQTTQSAISAFENGDTDPHLSTLQRYARAIGTSLEIRIAHRSDVTPGFHSSTPNSSASVRP
jgi:DNA-binding XRE family transcriptional regulator